MFNAYLSWGLDLRRLVQFLRETRDDPTYGHARTIGAIVCCFATLLFITGGLIVDTSIILLIHQAMSGHSIVPFILVETLNGLDAVIETRSFGEPNFILHVVVGEVTVRVC